MLNDPGNEQLDAALIALIVTINEIEADKRREANKEDSTNE